MLIRSAKWPGGKVARIATDGDRYEIWPDKLAGVAAGRRYDIEVSERQYHERTIRSIKKITPIRDESEQPGSRPSTGEIPQLNAPGEAEYVGRAGRPDHERRGHRQSGAGLHHALTRGVAANLKVSSATSPATGRLSAALKKIIAAHDDK
jgi:hypothetical protein